MTLIDPYHTAGYGWCWVDDVVLFVSRAYHLCSLRSCDICQDLLLAGSTGASWKSKQIYIICDLMNKGMTPYDLPEMLILSCSLIPQYRSLVFMVYGMLAVFTSMGWAYVTLILSHCVLLYSISLVKLRWLCFVAGLTTLATFKMEPFISWQVCVWHSENVKKIATVKKNIIFIINNY